MKRINTYIALSFTIGLALSHIFLGDEKYFYMGCVGIFATLILNAIETKK